MKRTRNDLILAIKAFVMARESIVDCSGATRTRVVIEVQMDELMEAYKELKNIAKDEESITVAKSGL